MCLHCKKRSNCNCDKTVKPKIHDKSKKRIIYSREFSPDSLNDNIGQQNYLYEKDKCFNYGIDFSSKLSIYFCSKCHSQFCRESKKTIQTSKAPSASLSPSKKSSSLSPFKAPLTSKKSTAPITLSPSKVSSPLPSPTVVSSLQSSPNLVPISDDECTPDLKFKLSIKRSDNSLLPQKWIYTKLTSHFDFIYDVEKQVKKMLNLSKLNKDDYSLSYQALNTRGLGTLLFDNDDWKEFLYDIKQMIKNNKVLLVNVSIIEKKEMEKIKKKEKR